MEGGGGEMKDFFSFLTFTLLLLFSAACPILAGILFLLASGVGLVDITL